MDLHATGMTSEPTLHRWTAEDAQLYAVAVGAGVSELHFSTDNSIGIEQRAIPSFALSAAPAETTLIRRIVGDTAPVTVVHGQQGLELVRPFPIEGEALTTTQVAQIYRKGNGFVIVTESTSMSPSTGEVMFRSQLGAFVSYAVRSHDDDEAARSDVNPARATPGAMAGHPPDISMQMETRENQALLFRLLGVRNPLHSDPEAAREAGFDRPILHGLCTYGIVCRTLVRQFCRDDPSRFRVLRARFRAPVYPGENLQLELWLRPPRRVVYEVRSVDGRIVIDQGVAEWV